MKEIWRSIPGYGGHYEASIYGQIRVKPRIIIKPHSKTGIMKEYSYPGRELNIYEDAGGYLYVTFGVEGKTIKKSVHSLIAEAFHGPRIGNLVVCHSNGIKTDNRPHNIRYDSQYENNQDRKRHGTYPTGELHPMAKLTQADVNAIRAMKCNATRVMSDYGISRSQACRILAGKAWI